MIIFRAQIDAGARPAETKRPIVGVGPDELRTEDRMR